MVADERTCCLIVKSSMTVVARFDHFDVLRRAMHIGDELVQNRRLTFSWARWETGQGVWRYSEMRNVANGLLERGVEGIEI